MASIKLKDISGTSAVLGCSCWAKSDKKIPVSTPSKIEVWEFESLIRGQDKILYTKESALANYFLPSSFLSESIWCVGFCEGWYFGSSRFVTDWVIKLLLYTEAGMKTNFSISEELVDHGGVINFVGCKLFLDARMSLLWFEVVRFRDRSQKTLWNFAIWWLFILCRFLWVDLSCISK